MMNHWMLCAKTSRLAGFAVVGLVVCLVAAGQDDENIFQPLKWRAIGPNYTGGRIVDIDCDPENRDIVYAASASGGLWKTVNRGTTWECIFENEGTISIGDIAVDQDDGQTIWVGTGEANNQRSSMWGDGIYKSTDGGKTWANMGLGDSHHIGRIVIDPNNSDIVYVAALGHLYSENEERGLFKTTDGGTTWEKVLYVSPSVGVVDVVLDADDADVIYAASYERLRRAWHFDGAGPGSGIYKSNDAGETWTRLSGGLPTGEIGRIGIDVSRQSPGTVYATISNQNLSQQLPPSLDSGNTQEDGSISTAFGFTIKFADNICLVESTGRGGGAGRAGRGGRGGRGNFQRARAGQNDLRRGDEIVSIAGISASDEDALIDALNAIKPGDRVTIVSRRGESESTRQLTAPNPRRRQIGGEVYKTNDGGESWTKVNERPVGGTPAYYYGQIRVDPQDDERVYLLSVPLYVSKDGGKKWSTIAGATHVDHHALWIDPDQPSRLILGNDGGFHFSYDYGATWDWVYNLPLCQFYAITVDQQTPYHVYGGLQDNGSIGGPSRTRSSRGVTRLDWYRIGGGDGFYVQVDPNDSNILFSESQFGSINRLDRSSGRSRNIRPRATDTNIPDRYNWNSPILMSSHDPRIIFFGANRLYRSYNRGDNWQAISPDLTTQNPERIAGNVPHCTITTIDQSTHDPRVLLVGTDDGKVQLSRDDGENWSDLSSRFPIQPSNWWCSRVSFCPHNADTIYVSFTGYREDDFRPFVFRSSDGGQSFESISANLPMGPVNVVRADPKSDNLIYVGTEFGVHVSTDKGRSWQALNNGLPRAAVHDLVIHARDNDLVVGTHGRGVFILDDISPLQQLSAETLSEPAVLVQPRNAVLLSQRRGGGGISGDRKVNYPNPPSAKLYYYLNDSGDDDPELSLVIENSDGEVVARPRATDNAGLNIVPWNIRRAGGFGRGRLPGRGAATPQRPVGPGTYWIVLKYGDTELRKKIEVEPDPGSSD